jgi:hypothetical protein
MWPFNRQPTAFDAAMAEVRALPEPSALTLSDGFRDSPNYTDTEPTVVPPLLQENRQSRFAEKPIIDKFPTIIGQDLSGAYVSSAFRLCNSGFRYQYVDLLDELLENDPDTRAVVRARILGVACGRYPVAPAKLGKSASDADRDIAQQAADEFALEYDNIPYITQRIQQLAWADWYGPAAHEIMWGHPSDAIWNISDLQHIHNRRLNYTHPTSWELYIYDQGLPASMDRATQPTIGAYGLPVSQYPSKFLVHTPSLSGQYPTRDGEGRYVAFYMLLKRMVTRCSAQDFERVIRPWVLGYFNRAMQPGSESPVADKADISLLNDAMQAFGSGSMNTAALPNTVKVELMRAAAAMTATEFLGYLNRSIAKGLLGQAFTTEPGPNGNLATAEVANSNTQKILEYSARAMADTLRYGLAMPWFRLNRPSLPRYFAPRIIADVSSLPTPQQLMDMVKIGTSVDMPIDIEDVASRTTLKLLVPDDTTGRRTRMVAANAGPNPPEPVQSKEAAPEVKSASVLDLVKPTNSTAKPTGSPMAAPKPKTN